MSWRSGRSKLRVDNAVVLVRDSGMDVSRLATLPGVCATSFIDDPNEGGPKAFMYRYTSPSGETIDFAQNPDGTIVFGPTFSDVARLGAQLRGRPLSDTLLKNMHVSCTYWDPPDLGSLVRLIDDWSDWRDASTEELDGHLQGVKVRCESLMHTTTPRVCLHFLRPGKNESYAFVVLHTDGLCQVVGLTSEEKAEDVMELADSVFARMCRA
jgi:hypothetical protein